jgi:hypothetical protein
MAPIGQKSTQVKQTVHLSGSIFGNPLPFWDRAPAWHTLMAGQAWFWGQRWGSMVIMVTSFIHIIWFWLKSLLEPPFAGPVTSAWKLFSGS